MEETVTFAGGLCSTLQWTWEDGRDLTLESRENLNMTAWQGGVVSMSMTSG